MPEFNDLFAAAEKGDWPGLKIIWQEMTKDDSPFGIRGPEDWRVQGIQSKVVQEIYGAFENIMERDDDYVIAYGRDIIASIPVGSIYFSGTNPGRFVITALCNSQVNGDPFFTVTQNALADSGYMHYLRSMYGTRIHIPTEEESTNAFSQYLNDACRRLKENKLRPGEEIEEIDGKLNVSGQIAVMAINGLLAKITFDKNPDRECYIEESFPLEWMYPHLAPHGLVMKIHREPLPELPNELVRCDREYWMRYIRAMIGDWMHHGTA